MARVTQDTIIRYALKYVISRASQKYNLARSTIYLWLSRYDGTVESLDDRWRRPHSHPNQQLTDFISYNFYIDRMT